jgi:secreted trypsin-like serine protease
MKAMQQPWFWLACARSRLVARLADDRPLQMPPGTPSPSPSSSKGLTANIRQRSLGGRLCVAALAASSLCAAAQTSTAATATPGPLVIPAGAQHSQLARPSTQLSGKVIGGLPAAIGEFRYAAFVYHQVSAKWWSVCTGSVVAPQLILTAAHCVVDDSGRPVAASSMHVVTGRTDVTDTSSGDASDVSEVRIEPAYDPNTVTNDVATLVLSQPVGAASIRVASYADFISIPPGTSAQVAGWGNTFDGQWTEQTILIKAPVTIRSDPYCWRGSKDFRPGSMICTDVLPLHDPAPCNGDSGGPLVAQSGAGETVLVGIVDFGASAASCTAGPAYYQFAPAFSLWLLPQLGQTPTPAPQLQAPVNIRPPHLDGTASPQGTVRCMVGTWYGNTAGFRFTWTYDGMRLPIDSRRIVIPKRVNRGVLRCSVLAGSAGGSTIVKSNALPITPD